MSHTPASNPLRRIGIMLLCVSLVACSTVRPVALQQAGAPSLYGRQDDLHLGDEVTIRTRQGESLAMKITALEAGIVEGQVGGRSGTVRLQDSDIAEVQRVELSGAKTAGLSAAVLTGLGVLLIWALRDLAGSLNGSGH